MAETVNENLKTCHVMCWVGQKVQVLPVTWRFGPCTDGSGGPGARGPGAECLRLLAEPVCFHHPPNFSIQWVKKQQLELDMERQTGSKLGKEFIKAVYCHPAYLTYMQSIS